MSETEFVAMNLFPVYVKNDTKIFKNRRVLKLRVINEFVGYCFKSYLGVICLNFLVINFILQT